MNFYNELSTLENMIDIIVDQIVTQVSLLFYTNRVSEFNIIAILNSMISNDKCFIFISAYLIRRVQ